MFKQMTKLVDMPVPMDELEKELGADWIEIKDSPRLLRGYAETITANRQRRSGIVPAGWTSRVVCEKCGPVYLWPIDRARVAACPWCINRAEGLKIVEAP